MDTKFDVSVIIPTYNRAGTLAAAIESIRRQVCDGVDYELLVVDNNSDDDTRDVVQSFVERGENVRYLFEKEQGVSHARNTGIDNAGADILAFMDDDVIAPPNWISKIKQYFEQYPDILFVGGKVVPRWNTSPPAWLTSQHWSPLALVDYGDEAFFVDPDCPICLVSASLGVRRSAFDRFGTFRTALGRCEDHEFELRVLRAGGKGLYTPDLVMTADVQNERLGKTYHRAWWSDHGKKVAGFRAYEVWNMDGDYDNGKPSTVRLLGSPSYLYKELARNLFDWVNAWARKRESDAFYFESQMRDLLSYIRETYELSTRDNDSSRLAEIALFVPRLVRKKLKDFKN
jgi:glucosyl-dolichyl phosphate glucuronosyltransferase